LVCASLARVVLVSLTPQTHLRLALTHFFIDDFFSFSSAPTPLRFATFAITSLKTWSLRFSVEQPSRDSPSQACSLISSYIQYVLSHRNFFPNISLQVVRVGESFASTSLVLPPAYSDLVSECSTVFQSTLCEQFLYNFF